VMRRWDEMERYIRVKANSRELKLIT
jgi:hypothetical protein